MFIDDVLAIGKTILSEWKELYEILRSFKEVIDPNLNRSQQLTDIIINTKMKQKNTSFH